MYFEKIMVISYKKIEIFHFEYNALLFFFAQRFFKMEFFHVHKNCNH